MCLLRIWSADFVHTTGLRHGADRPMRNLLGRVMRGAIRDASDECSPVVRFSSSSRSVDETRQAPLGEASSSFRHRIGPVPNCSAMSRFSTPSPASRTMRALNTSRAYARTTRVRCTLQGGEFLGTALNGWGAASVTRLLDYKRRENYIIIRNCVALH